jgi:hypothetical protein
MLSSLEDKFGHLEAASKDLASQVCQKSDPNFFILTESTRQSALLLSKGPRGGLDSKV